jgi:hypothetical protein
MHFYFFIVNRNGTLGYDLSFQGAASLDSNTKVNLASTFSSFHKLSAQLTPSGRKPEGLITLNSQTFKLQCFKSLTHLLFVLISSPNTQDMDKLLSQSYQLYADHVLKNPFYPLDQPIRIEGFNKAIQRLFGVG